MNNRNKDLAGDDVCIPSRLAVVSIRIIFLIDEGGQSVDRYVFLILVRTWSLSLGERSSVVPLPNMQHISIMFE